MKKVTTLSILTIVLLTGCGSSDVVAPLEPITKQKLGEKLFFDTSISLDRKTSCSTCHNPEHGFVDVRFSEEGVNQNVFVHGAFSVGDDDLSLGGRNAPTAAYAQFSPEFNQMSDGNYSGGQFHDGRAATLKIQAMGPPLDGAEMMMPEKYSVVERLKENPQYVEDFKTLYGDGIFDDIDASYDAMADSIAKFEKTEEFAPFDSKYDRFKRGEYTMTAKEDLGYSLFFSQANTNCATCHTLNSKSESPNELFTNYEYENIGTPRNIEAMNARATLGLQDANATFAGLGGTVKESDENWRAHLGKTKVPTLRNIAVTGPYMNNGVFKDLTTVLEFYDHMAGQGNHAINPETGEAWGENDNSATINHKDLEATKALSDSKIAGLESFLNMLTDKRYEYLIEE
ncbi:MAG: cytochrome c peroxidase [Campylobacterota bacterium]|nr:cytochrome c peroxidase [Campylobacterota bacterium]